PGVDPVRLKIEVSRDSSSSLLQERRKGVSGIEGAPLRQRHHVDVGRGPLDESQGQQGRATDHDDLSLSLEVVELLGQGRKDGAELVSGDVHGPYLSRFEMSYILVQDVQHPESGCASSRSTWAAGVALGSGRDVLSPSIDWLA